ncbi:MAG: ferrous iron transport protein A [Deltaproteobacteria bacterium]|nr:ferrous iron transport protein A [Deltaproteobacteria bacterium]
MNGNLMPLSMLSIGEKAQLVDVRGGHGIRMRLASMGLNPGVMVEMVQNAMHGPVILGVLDTRLAIGRGMSQKILVRKI